MNVSLDRFRAPTANDDLASCQTCGDVMHYEKLDKDGDCPRCKKEDDETDSN